MEPMDDFPETMSVVLDNQTQLLYASAKNVSRKHVIVYDGSTYRNTTANHYTTILPNASGSITTDTNTLQDAGTVAGQTVSLSGTTLTERTIVDDLLSATPPRPWKKIRTLVEFWSDEIGREMTMTVTTTNASATLTVPDNTLLTPGQKLTGTTNIPAGASILSIPVDSTTTVIMSHKATGAGDEVATFDGSSWLGSYWEDLKFGDAPEAQILL